MSPRRRTRLAGLFLCALYAALPAHAGLNTWTTIGPEGGFIQKVIFHGTSQSIVYARAASGFYRSTDGGAHWQQNADGVAPFAQDVTIDPTNSDRVYVVINLQPSRVFVSTDAGATFAPLPVIDVAASTPVRVAVSGDGNTLYTLNSNTIYRSTNRGQTWERRTDVPITPFIARARMLVDPADSATLYVADFHGFWATHDAGGSWINITPPANAGVEDLAIDPSNPNRLWAAATSGLTVSSDRGASWTLVHTGWKTAVALDPQAPSTVYTSVFGGAVLRGTAGVWTDVSGNLGSFHPNAIAVSFQDSAKLLVSPERGLYRSNNGGVSWSRSDAGLVTTFVSGFESAPARGRLYLRGTGFWSVAEGSDSVVPLDLEAFHAAIGAQSSGVAALTPVSESAGGLIAANGNRLALSLDEGQTWSLTGYPGASNDAIFDLAATRSGPSTWYASSVLTLLRSTNQGLTWTPITTGFPAGHSAGVIAIAPSDASVLYAGPRKSASFEFQGVGVYTSTNGGATWSAANSGMEQALVNDFAIHPLDPAVVYAATDLRLMKSVNGGATWVALDWSTRSMDPCVAVAIDPRSPNVVYAAGGLFGTEVSRSIDGGATWKSLVSPGAPLSWRPLSLAIDLGRADTVRVGTSTAGIQQITLRSDLQPDVAIDAGQARANIPLNAPVPYQFTIRNHGSNPAADVTTEIVLPPTNVSGVTASTSAGTCSVTASKITCVASALNAGDTISVDVSVTPTSGGLFDVSSRVFARGVDADTSNNATTETSFVAAHTEMSVAISGTATAGTGAAVQYVVVFTNAGPSPASGARGSYQAPGGMTLGTFSVSTGTCSKVGIEGLDCDFGTLGVGATATLTVNTTAAANAGNYLWTASVTGQGSDSTAANNTSSFSTSVTAPPPPPPPPPSNGGNGSGGGGGGGALSPLFLLGLLGCLIRRTRWKWLRDQVPVIQCANDIHTVEPARANEPAWERMTARPPHSVAL